MLTYNATFFLNINDSITAQYVGVIATSYANAFINLTLASYTITMLVDSNINYLSTIAYCQNGNISINSIAVKVLKQPTTFSTFKF